MSDKYIIRNCPNYREREVDYTCAVEAISSDCHNCTDCPLKQIVEMCKYYKKHNDCARECPSFGGFLNKLLNKLDIQEVK